jgi:hypothetical protein
VSSRLAHVWAKIVQSHAADAYAVAQGAEVTAEVVGVHRPAGGRREDQVVIVPGGAGVASFGELAPAVVAERFHADG